MTPPTDPADLAARVRQSLRLFGHGGADTAVRDVADACRAAGQAAFYNHGNRQLAPDQRFGVALAAMQDVLDGLALELADGEVGDGGE